MKKLLKVETSPHNVEENFIHFGTKQINENWAVENKYSNRNRMHEDKWINFCSTFQSHRAKYRHQNLSQYGAKIACKFTLA